MFFQVYSAAHQYHAGNILSQLTCCGYAVYVCFLTVLIILVALCFHFISNCWMIF